jgi:hypothetical protein
MKNQIQNGATLPCTTCCDLRVLRLTLKKKWFGMIASGEKCEEYREQGKWIDSRVNANKEYDAVEFKNGYGPNVPTCVVEYLGYDWATGNAAWGAVPGKLYKVIRLGRVISLHNARAMPSAKDQANEK